MLGASDRRNGEGLDFLFQNNLFVKASSIDAEHMIRRALFGESRTLVSMNAQNGMDADAFLQRYAQAGLTIGAENSYRLPEFGMPESGFTCMQQDSIYLPVLYFLLCLLISLFYAFFP